MRNKIFLLLFRLSDWLLHSQSDIKLLLIALNWYIFNARVVILIFCILNLFLCQTLFVLYCKLHCILIEILIWMPSTFVLLSLLHTIQHWDRKIFRSNISHSQKRLNYLKINWFNLVEYLILGYKGSLINYV